MAAPAGVPVAVGDGADADVVSGQAEQRRIDGLFLRGDEPDLHLPVAEGEDLGTEHGRVRDAQKLELSLGHVVPGDDEKPGSVRGAVDVGGLDGPVEPFFHLREAVEVQLGGRRQRLDDVFEGIMVGPAQQVEQEDRDLRVRQKLRPDVALQQVFTDGMVIGEITVVHERDVDAREGVGAGGMPDAALGRETLVGDPDMGRELPYLVIIHDGLGKSDHLQDHDVPAVGEDEGPLVAGRGVEHLVQLEAVLVHVLVLDLPADEVLKPVFEDEAVENIGLDPHEIAAHIGRLHLQARDRLPVVHRVDHPGGGDIEMGRDETLLHGLLDARFEEGDMEHVVVFQDLFAYAQLFRDESDRRDPAAFPVSPVVHLFRGLVDVLAGNGLGAAEPDHAAPALLFALSDQDRQIEPFDQFLLRFQKSLYPFAIHD